MKKLYEEVVSFRPDGSKRVQFLSDAPSKTDQSFKKDCDINAMVKRFTKTNGINNKQFMAYMAKNSPMFGANVAEGNLPDYELHLNAQIEAREMFGSLPSAIRKQFDNNPGDFLRFASDPQNKASLADMGLLTPEATQAIKASREASKAAEKPSAEKGVQAPANSST